MRTKIEAAFPNCVANNCIEIDNRAIIDIHDNQILNRSCIYQGAIGSLTFPYFTIKNPNLKNIHILAIDNCILFEADGQKCDFAAFDNRVFCFVEIKRALGKPRAKRTRKRAALIQLRATLRRFIARVNFTGYKLMACTCVGHNAKVPAAPASDLNLLVDFINQYNTELIDGNEITFN